MNSISSVLFNKNDKNIFYTGNLEGIYVWEKRSGNYEIKKKILNGHEERVNSLNFNVKNEFIISGSNDNKIIIWKNYEKFNIFEKHKDGIISLDSFDDFVASSDNSGNLFVWNINSCEVIIFEYLIFNFNDFQTIKLNI